MPYVVQTDLLGMVPDDYLRGATDDAESGAVNAQVWSSVADAVQEDVDGRLERRFSVPIDPVPHSVKSAARVIAAYLLFARRGVADDQNPWAAETKYWRERLDKIGRGEDALTADSVPAQQPAVLITEPSRTHSQSGNLMA